MGIGKIRYTYAICFVEVVVLLAIGVELPGKREVRQFSTTCRIEGMFSFDAIEVSIEDTGVPFLSEKDQAVCQGLEERLYGCLEGLIGLGVVVHDKGDGIGGFCLHKGVVEDGS
jgi:hypothetical protein